MSREITVKTLTVFAINLSKIYSCKEIGNKFKYDLQLLRKILKTYLSGSNSYEVFLKTSFNRIENFSSTNVFECKA